MKNLHDLAKLIRYFILISTTEAGSGHPSSALSATELMTGLFFGGFYKFDLQNPQNPHNDRLIFSKGHASPLFYSLYAAADAITETELKTLRKFGSRLEGHPAMDFPFTEAATGSLGQGLSVGVGMAINAKYLDKLPYTTYVLLGDSEMAEGSIWEAIQIAQYYKLDNLVGILDVNRFGQRGETMYGHDIQVYIDRISAFGWKVISIDGHNFEEIIKAFEQAKNVTEQPVMIVAKTLKGKGVSLLEDKDNWHGKPLKLADLSQAITELGKFDKNFRQNLTKPENFTPEKIIPQDITEMSYVFGEEIATRKAYGKALTRIYPKYPEIVALDAEVSNSTYAEDFAKVYPGRFFEMFIAEQNMVSTALGLANRGKIPFVSTFATFFTRAFDQIRMSQYSNANIKFVGSHAGVSIGEDGPSQMGLEDIAMFRSILESVVLYPADAVSTERLIEAAAKYSGIVYIRTNRPTTPVIYDNKEEFLIGGSKVLKQSNKDQLTIVSAGVTLFEALKAYEELKKDNIVVRVIDLYSIKPLDFQTLNNAAKETDIVLTVEDHYPAGGLGEAVKDALSATGAKVYSLAVTKRPKSGNPQELLDYEEISKEAIINKIKIILNS